MNLEIKENSTYTFSFEKIENGQAVNITTATIALFSSSGQEQLASTAMVISGNTATYSNDFSATPAEGTWDLNQNYKAVLTIDGSDYIRLYDIVRYPFINEVTQKDLDDENKDALSGKGSRVEGTADSGTVNTLVDSRLVNSDDLTGGIVEIYSDMASVRSYKGEITDHNTTTGTLTFTPDRETAVTTERYNATSSFDNEIRVAGEIVGEKLRTQDRRPYLILDNSQVKRMIIYKTFERIFAKSRRSISEEDVDHVNYLYYMQLFEDTWNIPLNYDENNDGNISDWEDDDRRISINVRR